MDKRQMFPTFGDIAAIIGICIGAQLVAGLVFAPLQFVGASQGLVTFLTYLVSMVAALWVVLYFRWSRAGGSKMRMNFGFSFKAKWVPVLLWGLVLMAATSTVIEPLLLIFPESWYEFLAKMASHGTWSLLTLVVLAPLLEEALFRGAIQPSAIARYGAFGGILTSASVFAIVHLIPMQVINAFFIGIVLGYIYYKTRSLVPVIILHAANNLVSYLMSNADEGSNLTGSLRDAIANDSLYWAIYGASVLLVVFGAFYIWKGLKEKDIPVPPSYNKV